MKKKLCSMLLIASMLLTNVVYGAQIHKKVAESIITEGAVRTHYQIFDDLGWQDINVIQIDLQNPNIDLDVFTDTENITKRQAVSQLVKQNNGIAAINADFFEMKEVSNPQGILVRDGQLETASKETNRYNTILAAFSLDTNNVPSIDYFKTNGVLYTPDGQASQEVCWFNRAKPNYNYLGYIDTKAMKNTSSIDKMYPDLMKLVVENGVVTSIVEKQSGTDVPAQGYIILGHGPTAKGMLSKFKVGDSPKLQMKVTPDIQNKKMVVTGGSILLKDGKIPGAFSFFPKEIQGVHPRSAVGFSKDKRYVYLMTVDGRQLESRGMTLSDVAYFLKGIGVENALSLDGGGSTAMVSRELGESSTKVVNSPSDGGERRVINGIGIRTNQKSDQLGGVVLKTNSQNVFKDTGIQITVNPYDTYKNPLQFDVSRLAFEVSGVQGALAGNTFVPTSIGTATITAKYQDKVISNPLKLNVLNEVLELKTNTKIMDMSPGSQKTLQVTGKDAEGRTAPILLQDLQWESKNQKTEVKNNTILSLNEEGQDVLRLSRGTVNAYVGVRIGKSASGADVALPDNTPFKDPKRNPEVIKQGQQDFKIAVFGDAAGAKTPMNEILLRAAASKINTKANLAVFTGKAPMGAKITVPTVQQKTQYTTQSFQDTLVIHLLANDTGMRTFDKNEWSAFTQKMQGAKENNILILLNNPLYQWKDHLEAQLVRERLVELTQKGKNVFVFTQNSTAAKVEVVDGVRYISLNGIHTSNKQDIYGSYKILWIQLKEGRMYYDFEPIIQKKTN